MNKEELLQQFQELVQEMVEVMRAKNHDYSGGADPFKNLRRHGPHGIVVRMDDKISRLDTLTNPNLSVKAEVAESIEDTARDLAVYALLLILLRRDNEQRNPATSA